MSTEKKEKKVVEIKVDDILPNRFQPRIKFDEASINDLSASIKEHGVIQPLVVRKIGDKYEIIAGERRYKASVMAGLETVPVIVTDLDDKDSAEVALIENVQRQNLTPIEEAVSYKKILDMGYLTQEQLALKLGKSQSSIANKLRLLNLDDEVQEALLNGQISERHARSLLKLSSSKQQVEMLNRIINERLTVRRTDEEIDKMLNDLFEADNFNEEGTEEGTQKVLEPEEKEDEIEHTQPLSFDFSTVEEGPKNNVFDMPQENNETKIFKPEQDETDFFGFNQNIMSTNEPIKDEFNNKPTSNDFVDINQIQEEAQDIYPKEESKDINSFLEPTLLVDEEINPSSIESIKEQEAPSVENVFDNNQVDTAEDVMPIDSNNNLELNEEMKPGKFFDLFNNNNAFNDSVEPVQDEPVQSQEDISPVQDIPVFNTEEVFNTPEPVQEPEYNRFDENVNIFDNPEIEEPTEELKEVVPQPLEAEEVPVQQTHNEETNLNVALEKIRSYAEELKKLGIDMNIEESDFENKYQITINIDK